MKKESYDDIKAMFDSDGVKLPEALFKENMVGKIKESQSRPGPASKPQRPKTRKLAALVSTAAVFALIVAAAAVASRTDKPDVSQEEPVTVSSPTTGKATVAESQTQVTAASQTDTQSDSGLITFQSEKDFINFLSTKITPDQKTTMGGFDTESGNYYSAAPSADGNTASDSVATGEPASSGVASSQTNIQVSGVDEADIIKNDGRYLYVISKSSDNFNLCVTDTESMKTVFSKALSGVNGGDSCYSFEMFLTGNRLIVLNNQSKKTQPAGQSETTESAETTWNEGEVSDCIEPYMSYFNIAETAVRIFDISDKRNITLVTEFTQDGAYHSSRLVDGYLYLLSVYNPYNFYDGSNDNVIPSVKGEKVSCDCLYAAKNGNDFTTQTVISGFSVSEDDPTVSKISIVGCTQELYCSKNTLYLLNYRWSDEGGSTDIFSFSLKNGRIEKKAAGTVPGSVNDNYCVDEEDGYLRLATTAYRYQSYSYISSVYILDEKLELVGKLVDMAPDEQIKSVRFIGNIAYIVTFRNTDPLFAVDLSDPMNPTILGQVKLPGFSEYLHPIGDHLLVGIGYDGDDEDADYQSLKITLFDISDPLNPAVKDSLVYKSTGSRVLNEPKSFLMGQSESDFFIPITKEKEYNDIFGDWYKSVYTLQYLHISTENGTLSVLATYTVPKKFNTNHTILDTFTGAYIGENIYVVADTAVYRFTIADGKNTGEASLVKAG